MIFDCKKELENDFTHYRLVLAKLKKIRFACHTTCTVTGVIAVAFLTSGMAVSLSEIRIYCGSTNGCFSLLFRIYVNSI